MDREVFATQDECLLQIADGNKPDANDIRHLPPWRAVMIARVCEKANLMTADEVKAIVDEAARVGGKGYLVNAPIY